MEQLSATLLPCAVCLKAAVGRVWEELTQQHLQTSSSRRRRRAGLLAGVQQLRRPLPAAATLQKRSLQRRALPKRSALCGSRSALQHHCFSTDLQSSRYTLHSRTYKL